MIVSVKAQVEEALSSVLTPSGIARWWDTPIPAWLDMTPRDMFDQGDTLMVLEHAKAYSSRESESFT